MGTPRQLTLVELSEELKNTEDPSLIVKKAVEVLNDVDEITKFVREFIKITIAEEAGEDSDDSKRIALNNLKYILNNSASRKIHWERVLEKAILI